jgi:hypothetical protein
LDYPLYPEYFLINNVIHVANTNGAVKAIRSNAIKPYRIAIDRIIAIVAYMSEDHLLPANAMPHSTPL